MINWRVFVDSQDVSHLVGSIDISISQSNVHNEISMSSISERLFLLCDPDIYAGFSRIEVQIDSRTLFFLIESRSGSMNEFTVWGRDITARDNTPWGVSKSVLLEEATQASSVVQSVCDYCSVTWDAYDHIIPVDFEAEGTPIEILQSVAAILDLVVRAQDDGSILIRNRYKVRPINYDSAEIDIEYQPHEIYDLNYEQSTGSHYNSVVVQSYSRDSKIATVELEDLEDGQTRVIGTPSHIRVYWTVDTPEIESTYVTDGIINQLTSPNDRNTFYDTKTELVEFNDGVGECSYPIYSLGTVEWIGDSDTVVGWDKYGTAIELSDSESFKLANVTYTVEFTRYELTDHYVETLLAVFFFDNFPLVNIEVYTNPIAKDSSGALIDKPGDKIQVDEITDEYSAVLRGENWIDQNKYDTFSHSFSSPYNEDCKDGKAAWLDGPRVKKVGIYHIDSVTINISKVGISNGIQVKQWQI